MGALAGKPLTPPDEVMECILDLGFMCGLALHFVNLIGKAHPTLWHMLVSVLMTVSMTAGSQFRLQLLLNLNGVLRLIGYQQAHDLSRIL